MLLAATTRAEAQAGRVEADWMAANCGCSHRVLSAADMAETIGSGAYAGGVLDLTAGYCNPLAYALGLARGCVAAGVRIHERSEVTRIGAGIVETARGRVSARSVVHATNGYAPGLTARTGARVLPINNYVAVTEPLPDPPMRRPVAVADSRFVVNYFWQTRDGRLVYGGGESYGRRYPDDIRAKVRRQPRPRLSRPRKGAVHPCLGRDAGGDGLAPALAVRGGSGGVRGGRVFGARAGAGGAVREALRRGRARGADAVRPGRTAAGAGASGRALARGVDGAGGDDARCRSGPDAGREGVKGLIPLRFRGVPSVHPLYTPCTYGWVTGEILRERSVPLGRYRAAGK